MRILRRLGLAASMAVLFVLVPTAAQAHSLDSSTLAVRLTDDSAEATVSVALEAVDRALGTSYATADTLTSTDLAAVTDYLDEHLTVTGADGARWSETYTGAEVTDVEGIHSFSIDVAFGDTGADVSSLVIDYDAVIETDASHEAVVVVTDAAGDISTAGVATAGDTTVAIGEATAEPGLVDMIGYGFHHVLEGADHLLFLVTLLVVAPLAASTARRWQPGAGFGRSLRRVVAVVTAFTLGHSLTLIAAALGWVALPTALVEVLVAASVGVAAVHAFRPLVRGGEVVIAGAFGLVHGLAFAGILADLGFEAGLSLPTLLAFNVGVEAAQLVTVALVFPSLFLLSRPRFGHAVRSVLAGSALVAATLWILDRIGILANPLSGLEDALVAQSWAVAVVLALAAAVAYGVEAAPRRGRPPVGRRGVVSRG